MHKGEDLDDKNWIEMAREAALGPSQTIKRRAGKVDGLLVVHVVRPIRKISPAISRTESRAWEGRSFGRNPSIERREEEERTLPHMMPQSIIKLPSSFLQEDEVDILESRAASK